MKRYFLLGIIILVFLISTYAYSEDTDVKIPIRQEKKLCFQLQLGGPSLMYGAFLSYYINPHLRAGLGFGLIAAGLGVGTSMTMDVNLFIFKTNFTPYIGYAYTRHKVSILNIFDDDFEHIYVDQNSFHLGFNWTTKAGFFMDLQICALNLTYKNILDESIVYPGLSLGWAF